MTRGSLVAAFVLALAGCGDALPAAPAGACETGARRCGASGPEACVDARWVAGRACDDGLPCRDGLCAARSCLSPAPGADDACGAGSDCCGSSVVPGGGFLRGYDGVEAFDTDHPATVSAFRLDDFPVTVGRFRAFVASGGGVVAQAPAIGAGAHARVPDSGWQPADTLMLRPDAVTLSSELLSCGVGSVWTPTPGAHERHPLTCATWAEAFAFCIWDGGRLPTEAELAYAEAAGAEQRYFPWSVPADAKSVSAEDGVFYHELLAPVGSRARRGKWGQFDLAGEAWNWTLDRGGAGWPVPCDDCIELTPGSYRRKRGGSYQEPPSAARAARASAVDQAATRTIDDGFRCARDL